MPYLVVNLTMLCDIDSMYLQDLHAGLLIWQGNLNLSIEPSWPHKSRIQHIWSVGGHDHFDLQHQARDTSLANGKIGRHALHCSTPKCERHLGRSQNTSRFTIKHCHCHLYSGGQYGLTDKVPITKGRVQLVLLTTKEWLTTYTFALDAEKVWNGRKIHKQRKRIVNSLLKAFKNLDA